MDSSGVIQGAVVSNSIRKRIKRKFKSYFDHRLDTPHERRKSLAYAKWVDLGFLRSFWTNEGDVAPGVFRANHPTDKRFEGYARKGVKTVLNLRNDVDYAPVKLAQESCSRYGLNYVTFPMAPRRAPKKQELLDLIALFPKLEKPILIHCKSGADRTGLASAIWLLTQEAATLEQAQKELGLKYLHLKDFETGVLDAVLESYNEFQHHMGFQEWIQQHYDPLSVTQLASNPALSAWQKTKIICASLWRYAQHREARWHKSFETPSDSAKDQRRARFFINWVDHGILRILWKNRAEIIPGVIRSNHPTLKRLISERDNGIKSIINLRGASLQPQYLEESALCEKIGLDLYNVAMSANRRPTKSELAKFFKAFDVAQRPVLIHCKSGADRTGLAAALIHLDQGAAFNEARRQLSPKFLHFRRGKKKALDDFLDELQIELREQDIGLRDWIDDSR